MYGNLEPRSHSVLQCLADLGSRLRDMSEQIFNSQPKILKKMCLQFAIFNFSEKLPNIFKTGLKKYVLFAQKSLLLKKYFERKNLQTCFCLC